MDSCTDLELLMQLAHERPSGAARTLAIALQTAFHNEDKVKLVRVAEVVKVLAETRYITKPN